MVHLIDLSYSIESGMPVYPGDDEAKLYQDRYLNKDGYNNSRLEIGMHIGTHIDIPRHLIDSDAFIDEVCLDRFMGNGCLIDVRGEEVIRMKKEYINLVKEDDIVLLYTAHDREFRSENYFTHHPVIERELAQFFIDKRIKMIGMDMPSPDKFPFEIHKIFFAKDIFIIENMTNLDKLKGIDKFEIMAFPLKIKSEASIVRAVARF